MLEYKNLSLSAYTEYKTLKTYLTERVIGLWGGKGPYKPIAVKTELSQPGNTVITCSS